MAAYTIKEISRKCDIRKFIAFPDRLYKDCKQYVPALHGDQMKSLTDCAPLRYCQRKLWLAYDEKGRIVGCGTREELETNCPEYRRLSAAGEEEIA